MTNSFSLVELFLQFPIEFKLKLVGFNTVKEL